MDDQCNLLDIHNCVSDLDISFELQENSALIQNSLSGFVILTNCCFEYTDDATYRSCTGGWAAGSAGAARGARDAGARARGRAPPRRPAPTTPGTIPARTTALNINDSSESD